MAVKSYSFLHFLLRLAGVTGFFAAIVGLVLWLAIGVEEGMYVAIGGGVLVLLAVLVDIPVFTKGMLSRRGAVGSIVMLQILLALVLLIGVNIFSFFYYTRLDLTRDRAFTLQESWRRQLAQLDQDTTIIVFQRHTAFGQSPENPPDNYDAAAQRKIVEKVKDLAEQFQDLGPRFRVEVLDIHDDGFEDRMNRYRKEAPHLAQAIENARENSIFFYAKPPQADPGFVQMLSYNDLFQLDREASLGAEDGERNLVLRDQGVDAFAHKILNIQQKRPRIAFAVTHEFLGVDADPFWGVGMSGVKRALRARGIDHVDLILKAENEHVVFTHDEHKYERVEADIVKLETDVEQLERKVKMYSEMEEDFQNLTPQGNQALNKKYFWADYRVLGVQPGPIPGTLMQARVWADEPEIFSESELEDFRENEGWKEGADYKILRGRQITLAEQQEYLEESIRPTLPSRRAQLRRKSRSLEEKRAEIRGLNVERLYEQKRITDLKTKLQFVLADCDVLVIPRLTLLEPEAGVFIDSKFHHLDVGQVEAIKEFMKAGKPILFCLGPPFTRAERGPQDFDKAPDPFEPDHTGDGIDTLLRELQIVMPAQVILHDLTVEGWGSGREEKLVGSKTVEAPPLQLEPVAHSTPSGREPLPAPKEPAPIRESLHVFAQALGKDSPKELRLQYPRPVYHMTRMHGLTGKHVAAALGAIAPSGNATLNALAPLLNKTSPQADASKIFLSTAAESWNEDYPFPKRGELPQPPEQLRKVPHKGTWREVRRGPFPVAVAAEMRLPPTWYKKEDKKEPAQVRVAVIGDGGVFKGVDLSPMREKLLLDVSNWLMGRDDLLARDTGEPWSFLRVQISEEEKAVWAWSMGLGLPLLFVYLGTIVMLKRRLR